MKNIMIRKLLLLTMLICLVTLLCFPQAILASNGAKLSASTETGIAGKEVTVTIRITNAKESEGGQFDLTFDPDILEPKKDVNNDFVVNEGGFVSKASNSMLMANVVNGTYKVAWITPNGAPDDEGVVCSIVFKMIDDGIVDLKFQNVVMAPDDFEVSATHTDGKVTVTDPADAKQAAIDAAIAAIAALPDDIKLTDKSAVESARALVKTAIDDHGAAASDITNLSKLVAAEGKIAKLEAIKEACDAVNALPAVDQLTLDHKTDVVAARALVTKAKTDHGAVDADFECLPKLTAAENRIRELEGLTPTPPTGGIQYLLLGGILILIIGVLAYFKRSRAATKLR